LIHAEAVRLDAYLRSVPELLSRSGKKLRRAMKDNALASVALQRLLETGHVIELKYKKQRLCLHSAHLPQQSAQVCHSQETSPDLDHDLSLQEVHQAYDRVRGRQLGSAVFISDLATELQIGFPKLHEWIRSEVIEAGQAPWTRVTGRRRQIANERRQSNISVPGGFLFGSNGFSELKPLLLLGWRSGRESRTAFAFECAVPRVCPLSDLLTYPARWPG
jgi:hypothetical protein